MVLAQESVACHEWWAAYVTDSRTTMDGQEIAPFPMLRFVFDLANLATLTGLLVASAAVVAVIHGSFHSALALALTAISIDHIDGALARRDRDRSPSMCTFGAHLDCYADFVTKGVFPPLLLLMSTEFSPVYFPVAALHICAIAVRYSYEFVPDVPATGLSPDYSILLFAGFFLGCTVLNFPLIAPILAVLMSIMAALNISPLRVPKLVGPWRIGFFGLLFGLVAGLLWTS